MKKAPVDLDACQWTYSRLTGEVTGVLETWSWTQIPDCPSKVAEERVIHRLSPAAWLRRFDEAFNYVERALEKRDGIVFAITTWPICAPCAPLWEQPPYGAVLRRLGLVNPRRR